ncbi:MAG: YfgM family protein [Porticoccaceae bacterium]
MAEHHIDEEQLEDLKRWWRAYGNAALILILLAVGGGLGWQQWQGHRARESEAASLLYMQMMDAASSGVANQLTAEQRGTIGALATTLKEQYASSAYADYARLMMAKLAVADTKPDTAAIELQSVMEHSRDKGLALIARLRLARVQLAREKYAEALALLDIEFPSAMTSHFAEARGDIHLAQGDRPAARAAYQSALDSLGAQDAERPLLQLKLNQVLPAQAADEPVAEENSR